MCCSVQITVKNLWLQVPCPVYESEGQRFQEQACADGAHSQEKGRESQGKTTCVSDSNGGRHCRVLVLVCSLFRYVFSEQAEAQRQRSRAARQRRAERKAQKKSELLALLAKEDEQKK